jgi:HK97 family phage major capsid protein
MNLQDILQNRKQCLDAAEDAVSTAERAGRAMTAVEEQTFNSNMARVANLDQQIKVSESRNTLRRFMTDGKLIPGTPEGNGGNASAMPATKKLSAAYFSDFHAFLKSRGTVVGADLAQGADGFGGYKLPGFQAASYEGGSTTGAPVVPSFVEQNIVELAPTPVGVRKIATVIPTVADLKVPRKTSFGTVGLKAEGDGTGSNLFTDSDVALQQFTLSAWMVGGSHTVSWELLQDAQNFQSFAVNDLLLELGIFEDNKFVNGTGTAQPQGLIGNVGAGVTGVAAGTDGYGSELIDATYDVMATLNPMYDNGNTRWLMAQATGLLIRKAQRKANLFDPIWTREGGKDFLHGKEVVISAAMPSVATGHTPVLYGDFKSGYLIGDRGGSGVSVKLLDQPKATEGLLIILAYRRVDGRVRRSEAIQAITLA